MKPLLLFFHLLFLIPNIVLGGIVEIYSLNGLDDNRGFCIDIRGHKSKAKVNRGLQAHTCYSYQGEVAVDQGFDSSKLMKNQFQLPAFNVCMEAESVTASASLQLSKCRNGQLQRFAWDKKAKSILWKIRIYVLPSLKESLRKVGVGLLFIWSETSQWKLAVIHSNHSKGGGWELRNK